MIDGKIRINETGPPATITLTPTIPITCPPCNVTLYLGKYIGLKVSHCTVTFSSSDPIMGSKSITVEAIKAPGSSSRVARIEFTPFVATHFGTPWDYYTPSHTPVCFQLHVGQVFSLIKQLIVKTRRLFNGNNQGRSQDFSLGAIGRAPKARDEDRGAEGAEGSGDKNFFEFLCQNGEFWCILGSS